MSTTQSATMREQLRQLIQSMPKDKIRALASELKEYGLGDEVPKEQRPPRQKTTVKFKRLITRHFTCINCDNKWVHTVELGKGEHVAAPGVHGHYIITVENDMTPITVQCVVSKCEHCQSAISMWSREKIEERYMQLLCRLTIGIERMLD